MFDGACRSETLPRARGAAAVAVRVAGGRSRLARLRHEGCAKCLLPRAPGAPQAVLINTSGGLTGGDRISWTAEAEAGAELTVTTQAAERIYRAAGGEARVTTRLTLARGATLRWLPQETILFDGGRLERSLEVEMAPDTRLLALEAVVLGRAAMGETVRSGHLIDRWRVTRAGRLLHADTLRLSGPVADIAARPGVFAGHRAAATLLYVGADAADRLTALRTALPATAGASALGERLVIRLLAPDARALRAILAPLVGRFGPIPAVWSC